MTLAPSSCTQLTPLPESGATVLRLLAASSPNWPEVALVAARDPALCLLLLASAPLARGELETGLNVILRHRLENLGADLLRAWFLSQPAADQGSQGQQALVVAECALHLALESHYPRPDEAYLGGLWYGLFDIRRTSDAGSPPLAADNPRQHLARLVRNCGFPGTLADALELCGLLDEQVRGAHPLVGILVAARMLAADGWENRINQISSLTGLATSSLVSLRSDVGYIVAGHAAYPPPAPAANALATQGGLPALLQDEPFRAAALHGLIVAAFSDLDVERAGVRLSIGSALLGHCALPIVLVPSDDGRLLPLLKVLPDTAQAWLEELALREDDEASCISLALRSETPTSCFPNANAPGRSMADWHVVRWLGHRGFICLPLQLGPLRAVAIIGQSHEDALDGATRWLMVELLSAATRTILSTQRQHAAFAAREAELHARFREHVRRIAHEATNPLTVIKSRLSLLVQSHADDSSLQDDMGMLNAELDRIDNLLRSAGNLPLESAEAPTCRVVDILHEMRALYAESLFTQRDIQFELRAVSGSPRVAMPASALKQVLLNLMRNASEALQPGSRLSLSYAGQIIADGRSCAELRLIDNGPGLPPERAANLFQSGSSHKGGQHQGMGLSIVREILAKWNASILCRSQSGSGTSFQIFIPLEQSV
ncbi:HAMP domain-containing histidine kinase [Azoarcus sp. L1K30]|uniref:ATP-binding protein n=1 Tax=Azoarcus sp. L1K30 TaxID=2820277 RepID=UPI001B83F045|nr:HAMP domain-containing sensor histidine kinase [Azoarcus sp. L1K30]MBR0567761.1 HAMP domain-containing histidine kinase [Azoarcus sp. L1K30]